MTTTLNQLTLTTERLLLRPLNMSDAQAIADNLNDLEVSQWLTAVSHPYGVQDAERFVEHGNAPLRFGLELRSSGEFIGSCSIIKDLGYWLNSSHWRLGLMKEACLKLVTYYFEQGHEQLTSGYFVGNERSASVLYHLGFEKTGVEQKDCLARGGHFASQRLLLTKAAWQSLDSG
jgi:RimJ/RimL family protein N-acetyltransferase